jgi:hypothetical protein
MPARLTCTIANEVAERVWPSQHRSLPASCPQAGPSCQAGEGRPSTATRITVPRTSGARRRTALVTVLCLSLSLRIREPGEPVLVMASLRAGSAVPVLPAHVVLVAVVSGVALLGLLWLPVLGDRLTGFLSGKLPGIAPRIFFIGLGIGVAGLVTGVRILDIVGACLIGGLVLAAVADNY